MGIRVGHVAFFVGPHAQGAPDDLETVIVDFIDGAQKRLGISVQELESETIARAIIATRQRKVLVKPVIEQSYQKRSPPQRRHLDPRDKNEPNRAVHDAILHSDIDIKVDYNTNIFHQKFMVWDRTAVLTGSTILHPLEPIRISTM
ncbi:MAG: phospholipase D-like domain-containing protein [Candidatus Thiodiazotropha sp.]